jgi:hypothetical protein
VKYGKIQSWTLIDILILISTTFVWQHYMVQSPFVQIGRNRQFIRKLDENGGRNRPHGKAESAACRGAILSGSLAGISS